MSATATFLAGGAWPWLLLVPATVAALVHFERRRARRLRELAGERASLLAAGWRPRRRMVLAGAFALATEASSKRGDRPGSDAACAMFATGAIAALALALSLALEKG
ncbi:MAG: hypothetical protein ABFS86_05040, partial [Planctomycetota bacterium]